MREQQVEDPPPSFSRPCVTSATRSPPPSGRTPKPPLHSLVSREEALEANSRTWAVTIKKKQYHGKDTHANFLNITGILSFIVAHVSNGV